MLYGLGVQRGQPIASRKPDELGGEAGRNAAGNGDATILRRSVISPTAATVVRWPDA